MGSCEPCTDFALTLWLGGCSAYYVTCLLLPWSANTISSWVDCKIDNWHNPCHPAKSQGEVIASTALLKYVEIGVLFFRWVAKLSFTSYFIIELIPHQMCDFLFVCGHIYVHSSQLFHLKTWIIELLISHWFPMWDFVCPFNLHFKTCYHWQYYFMSKI